MLPRFFGRDTPLLSRYRVAPEGDWVFLTHPPQVDYEKIAITVVIVTATGTIATMTLNRP